MDLKSYIILNHKQPIVFPKFKITSKWKFSRETPISIVQILQNKKIKFRIGKKKYNETDVQWEGKCDFIFATMREFVDWTQNKPTTTFQHFNPTEHWCYADYIYMRDLFSEVEDFDVLEEVKWSDLGFSGSEGCDSAIWIGSEGANTPCHYDTYGYNLVLQVCGRKRWTLFPQSDSTNLYPTRIPYEESSVFSKVNLSSPNPSLVKFQNCTPYVVTLEVGDLLFVPQHWWHYVENLELSVSVNAWFPSENDFHHRTTEAVTRLLIGCFMPRLNADHFDTSWLNPNEAMTSSAQNVDILRHALSDRSRNVATKVAAKVTANGAVEHKVLLEKCECAEKRIVNDLTAVEAFFLPKYCFRHSYLCRNLLNANSNDEKTTEKRQKLNPDFHEKMTYQKFVECVTKPNVVSAILRELEEI